jgi:hypothetical protein
MAVKASRQFICSGNIGVVSPAAVDGAISQSTIGCIAKYVAANKGWQITFENPVNILYDPITNLPNVEWDVSWNGANSAPDPPCFPIISGVVNTGAFLSWVTPTSTIPAHPESLGADFAIWLRMSR